MKKFIPFAFLLVFSFYLSAQYTLEVYPESYQGTFELDLDEEDVLYKDYTVHGHVVNTSNVPIQLRWKIEIIEAPAEWDFQVCDNTQCYGFDVTSNVDPALPLDAPVYLEPGDTSILDFHVWPRLIFGKVEAKIHLTPADDFNNIITSACYTDVEVIEFVTNVTEAERAALRVYPNPTSNYISISENSVVQELNVYNILGKQVRSFQASNGTQYDISDLPDGIYLVSLLDNQSDIVKTLRVNKRSVRP